MAPRLPTIDPPPSFARPPAPVDRPVRLLGSPPLRWAPLLLLAVLAGVDYFAQALLPALAAANERWGLFPEDLLDFVRVAIGG